MRGFLLHPLQDSSHGTTIERDGPQNVAAHLGNQGNFARMEIVSKQRDNVLNSQAFLSVVEIERVQLLDIATATLGPVLLRGRGVFNGAFEDDNALWQNKDMAIQCWSSERR